MVTVPAGPQAAQVAECCYCSGPLYAGQPIRVLECGARREGIACGLGGCTSPGCAGYIVRAAHVGCVKMAAHLSLVDGGLAPGIRL